MTARKDPRKRYSSTPAFAWPEGVIPPFRGLMPRRVRAMTAYVEHELKVGDRLDSLALAYYGDARLWWAIAQANPSVIFPADLVHASVGENGEAPFRAGSIILIPARPEQPE